MPTLTFVATANAVTYCGARPVFVDVEPETWTIDPAAIEAKITPRTKGIIVVHLFGHPADMDAISAIARRHGLFVLEDAAQAHGAEYRGRRAGSLGDIATFSFFGNKIVTTGEGGMVTTERRRHRRADAAAPDPRHGPRPALLASGHRLQLPDDQHRGRDRPGPARAGASGSSSGVRSSPPGTARSWGGPAS